MTSRADLHRLLRESLSAIAPEADLATLAPDADYREALDIDSMDFLKLVERLHKVLAVDVPERDYAALSSLKGAEDYLARRLGIS